MNHKILWVAILLLVVTQAAFGQQSVKGVVKGVNNGKTEILPFVNIYWLGTTKGVITDQQGAFTIDRHSKSSALVAKAIGYKPDTISITTSTSSIEFSLQGESIRMGEVVVSTKQKGSTLLAIASLKTEVITAAGLCKMACCNLAESFENSASVSVGYSDAVSGARQVKMLGLVGTYTQMLDENRPVMRGIAAPYGLTYTPGQWLESIQVSKGPGSVINGYEAITGQINVEHRKPNSNTPLFVNLYAGSDFRMETNIASSFNVNRKLSSIVLLHGSTDPKELDHNNDGFMDIPTSKQLNIANRWLYTADNGAQISTGFKALADDRNGGQTKDAPTSNSYGLGRYRSKIQNKQLNAYLKVGIPIGAPHDHDHDHDHDHASSDEGCSDEHHADSEHHDHDGEHCEGHDHDHDHDAEECNHVSSSIGLVADFTVHDQLAKFGIKSYDAKMYSTFANLTYQGGFNPQNRFTLGASFRTDSYNELLTDRYILQAPSASAAEVHEQQIDMGKQEFVVGLLGEYTYTPTDRITLIGGARIDHNSRYGWLFTPRANAKWDITQTLTLRASGGRGFRSPNPVTDNLGMLATGRQLVFPQELKVESAWTFGASIVKYLEVFNDPRASLSLDIFRTSFENQLIVDQEVNTTQVILYNLQGQSFTNSIQLDFNVAPIRGFSLLLSYRQTQAKVDLQNQGLVEKPLVDRFKALANVQYTTLSSKWTFDFTAQLNGQNKLPNLEPTSYERQYSPIYPMFFGQITYKVRKLDIYVGCENIGNYTQKSPIIAASSPFSTQFNSTSIWGPLIGRKAYVGLRFNL